MVCDARGVIRHVFGGFPGQCCVKLLCYLYICNDSCLGSVHDAKVFAETGLATRCLQTLPEGYHMLGTAIVHIISVVGDAAYPLRPYIHTPYKGSLTPAQSTFNFHHSSQRMAIETCFGRLKGRFKRLRYPSPNGERIGFLKAVMATCVVHNFIELEGTSLDGADMFYNEFQADPFKVEEEDDDNMELQDQVDPDAMQRDSLVEGKEKREQLLLVLLQNISHHK